MQKRLSLAGCVILNKKGELLLLRRYTAPGPQWELPGGKVKEGESPAEAAQREIREELGVNVSILRFLGTAAFEENGIHWTYTWFLASVERGVPTIVEKERFDSLSYFGWEQLPGTGTKLSPNLLNLLKAYNSYKIDLGVPGIG